MMSIEQIEERDLTKEVERLTALTEADGKEIGSYRDGTGLRGENRALEDRNLKLERVYEAAKKYIQARDDIERFALIQHKQTKLREAIAEIEDE